MLYLSSCPFQPRLPFPIRKQHHGRRNIGTILRFLFGVFPAAPAATLSNRLIRCRRGKGKKKKYFTFPYKRCAFLPFPPSLFNRWMHPDRLRLPPPFLFPSDLLFFLIFWGCSWISHGLLAGPQTTGERHDGKKCS
jgi:hypothetical protein